jgi:hypothetical protein
MQLRIVKTLISIASYALSERAKCYVKSNSNVILGDGGSVEVGESVSKLWPCKENLVKSCRVL